MRIREKLTAIDIAECPLKDELTAAKFTVLRTRDSHGAALALFNAHLHDPTKALHRTTLQNVVYQLDVALENPETQRSGLVFIYNMSNSKYSNFDYDLSQKILTLLKGCYPARLKKVLIVTAPLWFKAPFKVLRLFVREKLRDRVFTVSLPQLVLHITPSCLPKELGGNLDHDHPAWLEHCVEVSTKRNGEVVTMSSSQPSTPVRSHPTLEQLESLPVIICSNGMGSSGEDFGRRSAAESLPPPPPPPEDEDIHGEDHTEDLGINANKPSSPDSIISQLSDHYEHDDEEHEFNNGEGVTDIGGMALLEFIEHTRSKGRRGCMMSIKK